MKEYERNFKFKNGKVIYNPYNFERCFSLSDDNINNFYFRRDRIYLLCVGRFHKTKNQQACLEILAHLPVNYEIIFLGDGDTILNVKSYAKNLGVDKRCFFLGNVRNPFYFYRNCKYYISMSTSEGFPNSLIEAISFGCYPFVYDCKTGPKEILSSLYTKEAIYLNSCVEQYELGTLITRDEYYDIAKIIEKVNINEIIVNNECAKSLISNLNSYTIKKCYDF
nr:glycosyltransferase [Aliivibrio fischeri]